RGGLGRRGEKGERGEAEKEAAKRSHGRHYEGRAPSRRLLSRRRSDQHDRARRRGDAAARLDGDREILRRGDRREIGRLVERASLRVRVEDAGRDGLALI